MRALFDWRTRGISSSSPVRRVLCTAYTACKAVHKTIRFFLSEIEQNSYSSGVTRPSRDELMPTGTVFLPFQKLLSVTSHDVVDQRCFGNSKVLLVCCKSTLAFLSSFISLFINSFPYKVVNGNRKPLGSFETRHENLFCVHHYTLLVTAKQGNLLDLYSW